MIAALAIMVVLSQSPRTVALVFADRTEIVALVDAQAEFAALELLATRTEEQAKRHAALHLTLNTLFDLQRVRRDWEATGNKWEGPI